jgi:hypothetical protein
VRHIKCQCPVWLDGFDDKGKRQRRTLKTRSWSQAQARLTAFEGGRVEIPKPDKVPQLDAAIADYLADLPRAQAGALQHRELHEDTRPSRRAYQISLEPGRCESGRRGAVAHCKHLA